MRCLHHPSLNVGGMVSRGTHWPGHHLQSAVIPPYSLHHRLSVAFKACCITCLKLCLSSPGWNVRLRSDMAELIFLQAFALNWSHVWMWSRFSYYLMSSVGSVKMIIL